MDINEIINLAIAALSGGGVSSLINWKIRKRNDLASAKQNEIEVIRKTIADVYKPTIESLKTEVTELREEVGHLRIDVKRLRQERDECHQALSEIRSQVNGLAAGRPQRNPRTGRYSKCSPTAQAEAGDGNDQ